MKFPLFRTRYEYDKDYPLWASVLENCILLICFIPFILSFAGMVVTYAIIDILSGMLPATRFAGRSITVSDDKPYYNDPNKN